MEGTQFEFSYAPGVTHEQIVGFEMAGEIWSQYLTDNVTINIHVDITNELPENVIGGALPGMKKDVKYEDVWKQMSEDITTLDDLTAFNNYASGNDRLFELWGKMLTDTTTLDDITGFNNYVAGNDKAFELWEEITEDAPIQDDIADFNDYVTGNDKLLKLWEKMSEDDDSNFKEFSALIGGKKVDKLNKMKLTNANSKALGILDGDRDNLDGYIVMSDLSSQDNVQWNYNFSREGSIEDNELDFVSVAIHEVGHVLGFVSGIDDGDWLNVVTQANEEGKEIKADKMKFATPMDLFRYSGESEVDFSMGADSYFSIDGGKTNLGDFSTGEYQNMGGDGYQASHWKHSDSTALGIMDPALKQGQTREISNLDVTAMDVMGWDVVYSDRTNLQELYENAYQNALDNADDAVIKDGSKDVEKMIQESETYHGRDGSRSRCGRRNQLGLWQNIKFQTLDLDVEVDSFQFKGNVAQILFDNYLSEIDRDMPTPEELDGKADNVMENEFEVEKVVAEFIENSEIVHLESSSLDLEILGQLLSDRLENIFEADGELLAMPIG